MQKMLKSWLRLADKAEREHLAKAANTSVQYLDHIAADDEASHKRQPKVALAAAIERETQRMNTETKGRLPVVLRTELVGACAQCPYARKCLGDAAVAADFPVLSR